MTASSEMVLVDDFFEQFPSPTLRIVRSAEAHSEGSLANASPQSPTARRQPPPADRTAQADDNPDCGQRVSARPRSQLSRSSRSSVQSPPAPTSLREPHQPRAVPRVSNSPAVPHSIMRETRVLNPGAKSSRLSIPVGNSPRIDHGEERAQRHELGWSGTAARGSRRVFRDGRDEKSLFGKREGGRWFPGRRRRSIAPGSSATIKPEPETTRRRQRPDAKAPALVGVLRRHVKYLCDPASR